MNTKHKQEWIPDAKITKVSVAVTRLIAGPTKILKKYENITIHAACEASVAATENPDNVFKDCLYFCQLKIIGEMDRMEAGLPPAGVTSIEDEIQF